ncbi:MAG: hypothetical protein H0V88_00005 [Pyrinomonadaceae bacterium]|nr:hypothetical protein [Pyrinomonadaceae bacterium]
MAELFQTIELRNNNARRGQRLLRAVAGSFVLHLFVVALIFLFPDVRSVLRLSSMFSGVEYADEAYTKTKIRERAQIINIADMDGRFRYPDGYFSKKVPPEPAVERIEVIEARPTPTPQATPRPTPAPTPTPQVSPTPRPSPQASPETANASANENTNASSEAETERELDRQAAAAGVKRPPKINARPFKDLLARAKEMRERGEIDLNQTIEITIEADRNPDGTLRAETTSYRGNPNMKSLAMDFVAALSDSGALSFLEGVKHMRMTIRLDQQSLNARITSNMDSAEQATELARGYGIMLVGARFARRGKDEGEIWNNTSVSSNAKQLILQFNMTREAAGRLIAKQL